MISPVFFSFFKILILWVLRRVRGQKMVQNDKKFCLSHSTSQKPYIMWLSFLVHMYKMIENDDISWCVFQFFKILIFRVFRGRGGGGGWKGKKWPKMTNSVCPKFYFRNHISYDLHLWYTCVKNGPKWQKFMSIMLHIIGTIHHTIVIYGTHVQNDDISSCLFYFFEILIFQVVRG